MTFQGAINTAVSAQWARRPADQRFTSLYALRETVRRAAERSRTDEVRVRDLEPFVDSDTGEIRVHVPGASVHNALNHWSFGQLAAVAGAPAHYLRRLPPELAVGNLQYGLARYGRDERAAAYRCAAGGDLRALTSTSYGRIYDVDVADAVIRIAGDGVGETQWKVPGTIDWSARGIRHNPNVDVTTENTTLYASDRDIFLFLCDDTHPIEVGKLPNGDPDLMFRGFYVWNSEVGSRTFGVACMYLRGVCQNRILWGVEGFQEITFRHSQNAPERFVEAAVPALQSFAGGATGKLLEGVAAARQAKVASDPAERIAFLQRFGFTVKQAGAVAKGHEVEEGRLPETAWDMAQAVTAYARRSEHQDSRVATEAAAGRILAKAI